MDLVYSCKLLLLFCVIDTVKLVKPPVTSATVFRTIRHIGFHREIVTEVIIRGNHATKLFLLKEQLPSDVYVDEYHLKSLKSFGGPKVLIPKDIDIEQLAEVAQSIKVLIYEEFPPFTKNDERKAVILLPVHVRYHKPHEIGTARFHLSNPAILLPCLEKGYVGEVHKEPCNDMNTTICNWCEILSVHHNDDPILSVPVGNDKHASVVAAITTAVVAASSFYLAKVIKSIT